MQRRKLFIGVYIRSNMTKEVSKKTLAVLSVLVVVFLVFSTVLVFSSNEPSDKLLDNDKITGATIKSSVQNPTVNVIVVNNNDTTGESNG